MSQLSPIRQLVDENEDGAVPKKWFIFNEIFLIVQAYQKMDYMIFFLKFHGTVFDDQAIFLLDDQFCKSSNN
ncbi:hypothetical protein HZS_5053 [Henneguya salminicola]|nr:hypothetical protein HZS_5053 [Henneguya salminicola]